jgi:hypothetical protein
VGVYQNAGLSQYTTPQPGVSYGTGANFPVNWSPRYAIAAGFGANPDHREDYHVHSEGPRLPATTAVNVTDYMVNPKDSVNGFIVNGTLPVNEPQGVHSLTDVPVYAMGPCQETFGGTYNNVDIFYKFAACFGLGQPANFTKSTP